MTRLFRLFGLACVASVSGAIAYAQMTPGLPARPTPNDYASFQQTKAATYAASLVPADEVKHIFAVDVSKTYIVFEVACYPGNGKVQINPDNFLVKVGATSEFVHAAAPVTVASVLARKDMPKPPSNSDVAVSTAVGVGYETATDPVTGRRVHGTYTDAEVGVGIGSGGPSAMPYPPGRTPQDLDTLEAQLSQRALPPGSFTAPVAGFLYFPAKELKKNSAGQYELDYLGEPTGEVALRVPAKNRK